MTLFQKNVFWERMEPLLRSFFAQKGKYVGFVKKKNGNLGKYFNIALKILTKVVDIFCERVYNELCIRMTLLWGNKVRCNYCKKIFFI